MLSISKHTTDALVDLTVRSSDGVESTITGTPEHPYYVPAAHDYVAMGKLTPRHGPQDRHRKHGLGSRRQ